MDTDVRARSSYLAGNILPTKFTYTSSQLERNYLTTPKATIDLINKLKVIKAMFCQAHHCVCFIAFVTYRLISLSSLTNQSEAIVEFMSKCSNHL